MDTTSIVITALILTVITLVVIIIIISKLLQKRNEIINSKLDEFISSKQEEIKKQCSKELSTLKDIENKKRIEEENLKNKKQALSEVVEQIESRRAERLKSDKELVEATVKGYYDSTILQYRHDLQDQLEILQEMAQQAYQDEQEELSNALLNLRTQLAAVQSEVDDWEARRDAINKDIMRQRELQESQEFYKINLTDEAIEDINVLFDAKSKLHHHEILDKLIYDGYVARPVLEMVKRVLRGGAPCGIYKITRLKTGEVYIGKSTDVKSRWQEHCKSCFNVGSIAHSILHTTMKKDGIQNFTFELIEECPKDKLTEREKFYINLYNSKNYGLNEKVG